MAFIFYYLPLIICSLIVLLFIIACIFESDFDSFVEGIFSIILLGLIPVVNWAMAGFGVYFIISLIFESVGEKRKKSSEKWIKQFNASNKLFKCPECDGITYGHEHLNLDTFNLKLDCKFCEETVRVSAFNNENNVPINFTKPISKRKFKALYKQHENRVAEVKRVNEEKAKQEREALELKKQLISKKASEDLIEKQNKLRSKL